MTGEQKQLIITLRQKGLDYAQIGERMDIPKNTVKTFCWRNLSKSDASEETKNKETAITLKQEQRETCQNCGKSLAGTSRTKPRKFCCDECRQVWWRKNRHQMKAKPERMTVCAHCGEVFDNYGNAGRKYCTHGCYIASRFGEAVAAT